MLTETMSDILARRYIRAACAEIRNATRAARTKRDEFYETLLNGLLPELSMPGQAPRARAPRTGPTIRLGRRSKWLF